MARCDTGSTAELVCEDGDNRVIFKQAHRLYPRPGAGHPVLFERRRRPPRQRIFREEHHAGLLRLAKNYPGRMP
jgi:hypothetical protein